MGPSETNTTLTPLRGDTSSAPFGGTFPSRGRLESAPLPPRTPQGEGLRVRHSHRGPIKGKANGGVSFNAADPSRGRLTEACHSTPRTPRGKAGGCGRGKKKGPAGPVFLCFLGCAAHCALLCSFWSMAVNSGGRGQWSSTGSPVRGWMKRRPVAWRHWPVRPGTGFLAP